MPVDLPANLRRAPFRLRFEVRRVDLHGFQRIDPFGRIVDFLVYAMRRVACNTCGVTVELVPWADLPLVPGRLGPSLPDSAGKKRMSRQPCQLRSPPPRVAQEADRAYRNGCAWSDCGGAAALGTAPVFP